jgi:hypothetical protein
VAVSVSLLKLVAIDFSRPVWPEKFAALVEKLEENPGVKAQWGVIADWCQENDEPELAEVGSQGGQGASVPKRRYPRVAFRAPAILR